MMLGSDGDLRKFTERQKQKIDPSSSSQMETEYPKLIQVKEEERELTFLADIVLHLFLGATIVERLPKTSLTAHTTTQ